MTNQQNHSSIGFPRREEMLALIEDELNPSAKVELLERIKQFEPEDDFGKGLKKYLDQNENSIESLHNWIERSLNRETNKRRYVLNMKYNLAAVASVFIILSIVFSYYITRNESEIWVKYYKTDPGFPVLMGNKAPDAMWMQQYRLGNYQETLQLLNKFQNSDTVRFYRAACYFELDETQKCLNELNRLRNGMQGKTDLLKAFCYWRDGDIKQSRQIFQKLCATENGVAASQACSILEAEFNAQP
jgi:hypothetical protein